MTAPVPERFAFPFQRRLGQGAELVLNGAHFRIWAPERHSVDVVLDADGRRHSLTREGDGHWSATVDGVGAGTRYRYRLDGDGPDLPDPASRFLPEGPHGPSELVDSRTFAWTDESWAGVAPTGQVLYELHVGTFSPEGTWRGAADRLHALKELGVTVIELMPVGEFPGTFGWGYDGVAWFAPSHLYGAPDDLRRFVDQAHALGIGVILDVVYNHLGPDGNYLERFSPHYFSDRANEWGRALNFDGDQCAPVRRFVTDNAAYWVDEFHMDGLRLDATQSICDGSPEHIIATLATEARAAAGDRRLLIIAENEPQDANLVRPRDSGGLGLDALWNDDFHHSATVALTGRRQAYFSDYHGTANEWLSAAKHGFLFQGQRSAWQKKRRGQSARSLPPHAFVAFLENHDQIANSLWSTRPWQQSSPACHRAMTALLLLGPWTPLLFQGQEWNASSPFYYFADHRPDLAELVRAGRATFMSQFPGCVPSLSPDPASPQLFEQSRLRWEERSQPAHQQALLLHRDLLALRRDDPVLGTRDRGVVGGGHGSRGENDGNSGNSDSGVTLEVAALSPNCGLLRYFATGPDIGARPQARERLLLVNLGPDIDLPSPTEPLLSPPSPSTGTGTGGAVAGWRILWSSEDPRYGGWGTAEPEGQSGTQSDGEDRGWRIPGAAAVLLGPREAE